MIPTGGTALAEARLLFALWVDSQRDVERWLTREIARDEYHTDINDRLWASLLTRMKRAGLVETYAERKDLVAMLVDHATVKLLIEQFFEANTLEVSWKHERVLTDSQVDLAPMLAMPDGWTLMICDKVTVPPPVESSPKPFVVPASSPIPLASPVASQSVTKPAGEGIWTKAGVILTAIGLVVAIAALYLGYLALK